jgi:hypothetical protein
MRYIQSGLRNIPERTGKSTVGIKLPGRRLGKIEFRVLYASGCKDGHVVVEGIGGYGLAIMLCGLADSSSFSLPIAFSSRQIIACAPRQSDDVSVATLYRSARAQS